MLVLFGVIFVFVFLICGSLVVFLCFGGFFWGVIYFDIKDIQEESRNFLPVILVMRDYSY